MYTYLRSVMIGLLASVACSLASSYNFVQEGTASYYANSLQGQPTASGALYHPDSLTAAHRSLPLGTEAVVINPTTQRQVRVTINDRGPFHSRRIIDLSHRAADSLGILRSGVGDVIIKAQLPPEVAAQLQKEEAQDR